MKKTIFVFMATLLMLFGACSSESEHLSVYDYVNEEFEWVPLNQMDTEGFDTSRKFSFEGNAIGFVNEFDKVSEDLFKNKVQGLGWRESTVVKLNADGTLGLAANTPDRDRFTFLLMENTDSCRWYLGTNVRNYGKELFEYNTSDNSIYINGERAGQIISVGDNTLVLAMPYKTFEWLDGSLKSPFFAVVIFKKLEDKLGSIYFYPELVFTDNSDRPVVPPVVD